MAKDAADDGLFITVFVTSEGQAPIQMLGKFYLHYEFLVLVINMLIVYFEFI